MPYYQVKYIHYFSDGTYRPYEYKGNIVEVAEACFNQLKAEIKQREFVFVYSANTLRIIPKSSFASCLSTLWLIEI